MQSEIERRAYALWEADGRPAGADQHYWFRAVAELAETVVRVSKPAAKKPRVRKAA